MNDPERDEEPYTVGDLRRAIEGLPDNATVDLRIALNGVDELTDVYLEGVAQDQGRCLIALEVYAMDPYGDDDDDDDEGDDAVEF